MASVIKTESMRLTLRISWRHLHVKMAYLVRHLLKDTQSHLRLEDEVS